MAYPAYKLNRLTDFILALAAAGSFFVVPTGTTGITIQPFNFLVCAASVLVFAEILLCPTSFQGAFARLKEYVLLLILGAGFILLGGLRGIGEGFGFGYFTLKELGRLYFMFWTFLLFSHRAAYGGLEKKVYLAFFAPLILLPALFARDLDQVRNFLPSGFLDSGYKLQAFQGNGSSLAVFLLIPLAFLFARTFSAKTGKRDKILGGLGSVIFLALLYWSHSRGGILSAAAVSAGAIALAGQKNVFPVLKFLIIAAAIFLLAFAILPRHAKISLSARFSTENPAAKNIPYAARALSGFSHSQERQILWPKYISFLARDPLGFGPEYANHLPQKLGLKTTAHNTLIQAGLIGGWGFLAVLLILTCKLIKNCFREVKLNRDPIVIGIFLAAVGVLVMAFLNDYLLMKPIWILAALIAGRSLRAGAKPAETS